MIKQDYKSSSKRRTLLHEPIFHHIRLRWGEITAVAVGILLLGLALSSGEDELEDAGVTEEELAEIPQEERSEPVFTSDAERIPLAINWDSTSSSTPDVLEPERPPLPTDTIQRVSVEIKSGDTLSSIFKKQGFSPRDVYNVTQNKTAQSILRKIRPGKTLVFEASEDGTLEHLYYQLSVNETLQVTRVEDGFDAEVKKRPIEKRQAFASGIIEDSLFNAGKQAGMSDGLIIKLANIFGWDIDFVLDVRKNDSFALIYEEKYLDGEFIGNGEILAAQFINQGDVFRAVRYKDSKGDENYFTPTGKSMRKAFLRTPVNFMYISSNFNPRRFHPIQKRWKAHRGVDYRAPTGTPVYAAGDGKVTASSYNKYNGKYVFIQHGNSIVTKYLHLSRRAVSYGKRVKQGQVIGYVGSTGMSQAPHLHYEFVVNGVHRNPRTVKLPEAQPINKKEEPLFEQKTQPLLASLNAYQRLIANNSEG
ncbi:peptidoglycan DD-metalloendopeptidase family protein [Pleionea sediminis]|uniref:peptidoglycan DD-metalloendopeptidase family protein n=1 Tax=Pleionea sediminis TaxID=2569479 RepID=UPI001186B1D8|nr:peptidoglycan DD-metalloendopeptidase family protein [Pleionea sediminis]